MATRYEARNNCFRMKKGVPPVKPEIIEEIKPQIEGRFSWSSFADVWDVTVKNGKPVVFESVKDINAVTDVCSRKSLVEEMGVEKEWEVREQSIIDMIEAQFLDGIMTWTNYRRKWSIRWDDIQNRIVTHLLNLTPHQIEVTQAMIDQKIKEQEEAAAQARAEAAKASITMDMKPMTEEEKELFMQMLNKENK